MEGYKGGMHIARRVRGWLEGRHAQLHIARRVSGWLEGRHVHFQESKWMARKEACTFSGE